MLNIADRLGYPRNYNMWCYSRRAVFLYVRFDTKDPTRKRMTAATGGKLPFEGETGFPEHIPWRIYPFQTILKSCRGQSPDDCLPKAGNQLIQVEDEILRTYLEIDQQINRVTAAGNQSGWTLSNWGKNAEGLGPVAVQFLNHLHALQRDKDTMYSVYVP